MIDEVLTNCTTEAGFDRDMIKILYIALIVF